MTGERPRDEEVPDSGSEATEQELAQAEEPSSAGNGADEGVEVPSAADLEDAADDPGDADSEVDPGPMRETSASQRLSGPTQTTVVSQEEAAAVVAAETGRKTLDAKGRPVPADDELPRIDDRVSKLWVGLIAAVFVGILLYGLLGGKAGFFSARPTPSPSPSAVPTASASPRTSATPRPSASPTAAASTSPALSPGSSPGPSPSVPAGTSAAPTTQPSPT